MPITIFYCTQQFQNAFEACRDTVLKLEIEARFKKLEAQASLSASSSMLRHYTPNILVVKIFGRHNSRIIIHRQKVKKVTIYFVRLFFDKRHYNYWRKVIEPEISSGLWEIQHPLSKMDLDAAYATYQSHIQAHKNHYYQKLARQDVPVYMQNWFDEHWFKELQHKSG